MQIRFNQTGMVLHAELTAGNTVVIRNAPMASFDMVSFHDVTIDGEPHRLRIFSAANEVPGNGQTLRARVYRVG